MRLTQDILLDLVVVLGLAVVLGLGGTFLHRLAARRRSSQHFSCLSCYSCRMREAFELSSRRESRE